MKNKPLIITLISIFSVLCIGLIVVFVMALNGKFRLPHFSFNVSTSNKLVLDKVYDGNYDIIEITSKSGDIEIKQSDDINIRVIVYGKKKYTNVDVYNSKLKITVDEDGCKFFCFNKKIPKIVVYVPASYEGKFKINDNFGDIEIDEFKNSIMEITADCGDISVKSAKEATITNKYGDIEVDNVGKATINESAGDVKIGTANILDVNNNFGDIKIDNITSKFNIKNDCGDVKIDTINIDKNSYIKDNLGDIKINTTNEIYIDAKTKLGDVEVNDNFRKSDITLKIENDCGDIEVNK